MLLFFNCSRNKEQLSVIADVTQKQIIFPEAITYQIGDKMIDFNPSEADYKIIVYIDSTGCT
ncbi:MAG: hypothetical protein HDS02_04950 [Bacteroides sp.]|nr:hypothetical protein [Bacteroides sp.]